jgi:hypothetical protein
MESVHDFTIGDLAVLIGRALAKDPQQNIRVQVHFNEEKYTQICTFVGTPEVLLKAIIDDVNDRFYQTIVNVEIDAHVSKTSTSSPKSPEIKIEPPIPSTQSSFQQTVSEIAQRVIESDAWTKLTDHVVDQVVDYGVKKFTDNLTKGVKESDSNSVSAFDQARNNALKFLNLIIKTLRDDKTPQTDSYSRAMELIKNISANDSPDKYKEKVQNIIACLKELCRDSNLHSSAQEVSLNLIHNCFMSQVKS